MTTKRSNAMINVKRVTLEGSWVRIGFPGIGARKFCVKNFSESDIYASLDAEEDLDHCVKIPRDTGTYIMRSESATKYESEIYVYGSGEVEVIATDWRVQGWA